MKTFFALTLAALLTGCNTSRLTVTKPGGERISVFNARFAWATESYKFKMPDGSTLEAQKSNADAQTAEAIAAGVARGLSGK
jgi:hypothetical protein